MKRLVPVTAALLLIAVLLLCLGRARRNGRTYEDAVMVMAEGVTQHE